MLLDELHTFLVLLKVCSKNIDLGKLVGHLVLHFVDLLSHLLHLLFDTPFKVADLVQIGLAMFNFDLKLSSGAFGIIELALLEIEVTAHVLDLLLRRQLVLPGKSSLRVLQQSSDCDLVV